jgi:hypothetical protein
VITTLPQLCTIFALVYCRHKSISAAGRSINATLYNLKWNGNEFSGSGSSGFSSFYVNGTANGNILTGQVCHPSLGPQSASSLLKIKNGCKKFSATGN